MSKRLRQAIRRLRAFGPADGANVTMIVSLAAPMLVGAGALSVETGYDYFKHNSLQSAADAAAYAGALERRAGHDSTAATNAARSAALANGWSSSSGTIQVYAPPTSGAYAGQTGVEVRLAQSVPRFLTAIYNSRPIQEQVRSVAIYRAVANACLLALNPTASKALQVQGNSNLTLQGCDVMTDSIADDALNVWGSARLSAECAVSAGGITNKAGLTLSGCPGGIVQAPRAADPLAGLAIPATGPVRSVPNGGGTINLSPGWYSGGMDLRGNVNLAAGVYYVSGGTFKINANAVVNGSGVTIYLASGSQVSMQGNSTVRLYAPTSGTYKGVLFFGSPSASGTNTFNGDNTSSLTGDLYFPSQEVDYIGNFSGSGGCTHIIADTIHWNGNASLNVNCGAQSMIPIPARQAVALVE